MQELKSHYNPTSEGTQRKQFARSNLKKIFYKNENNLSFEKYITKINGVFNVLGKYGFPLYEKQMVDNLL